MPTGCVRREGQGESGRTGCGSAPQTIPISTDSIHRGSGHGSPLLANLYMNRFLKYWRLQEKGQQYQAKTVAYADDFVILSRRYAEQARDWKQTVMSRIGLTLNEQKTSIRDARTQDFDFLGYTFGPRWWWKTRSGRSTQREVGWQNYFCYGTPAKAYQGVNLYVYDRVRHFLRRRHKITSSLQSRQFPITAVFATLGVHRMRTVRP
jgi:RNA-directed DNA polymerase